MLLFLDLRCLYTCLLTTAWLFTSVPALCLEKPLDHEWAEKARARYAEANNYLLTMPAKALNILQQHHQQLPYLTQEEQFDWLFVTYRAAKALGHTKLINATLENLVEFDTARFQSHKRVSLLSAVGIYLRRHEAFDLASRTFQCAFSESVTVSQKLALSVSHALISRFEQDYDSAAIVYQAVINKARQTGAVIHQANANNNLGVVLLMQNKPMAATTYFAEALELNQVAGRRSAMINASVNLLLSYLLSEQQQRYQRLNTRVAPMIEVSTNAGRRAYYNTVQILYDAWQQGGADSALRDAFREAFNATEDSGIQTILATVANRFGILVELKVISPPQPSDTVVNWLEARSNCNAWENNRLSALQLAAKLMAAR